MTLWTDSIFVNMWQNHIFELQLEKWLWERSFAVMNTTFSSSNSKAAMGLVENKDLRPKNEDHPKKSNTWIAWNGHLDRRYVRNNKIFNYQWNWPGSSFSTHLKLGCNITPRKSVKSFRDVENDDDPQNHLETARNCFSIASSRHLRGV